MGAITKEVLLHAVDTLLCSVYVKLSEIFFICLIKYFKLLANEVS